MKCGDWRRPTKVENVIGKAFPQVVQSPGSVILAFSWQDNPHLANDKKGQHMSPVVRREKEGRLTFLSGVSHIVVRLSLKKAAAGQIRQCLRFVLSLWSRREPRNLARLVQRLDGPNVGIQVPEYVWGTSVIIG